MEKIPYMHPWCEVIEMQPENVIANSEGLDYNGENFNDFFN